MYIAYDSLSEDVGKVTRVIFNPTLEDRNTPGREVAGDSLPEANGPVGFSPVLMINLKRDTLYYDYVSSESSENLLYLFRSELTALQKAFDDFILWGV